MKPRYTDLLPSYLKGPNIQCHGELIDSSTEHLYDGLGWLRTWNDLTRPVLIQKVQTEQFSATYTVHVELPYAISSIRVEGDYTALLSFDEEDLVTSQSFSFTLTNSDVEEHEDPFICGYVGIVNADLLVEVETFEGYTFRKAYPENDTVEGNVHDHDQFLDKLGTVLSVPRRVYSEFGVYEFFNIAPTVPSWFGKRAKNVQQRNKILSCTEDDYYYSQRLQQFITDFMVEGLSLEKSKLRAVYDAVVTEELNYNDLVCHMDVDDMDEKNMADNDTLEANTYVYKVARPDYCNLPVPSAENLSDFLRAYVSVTKNVLVLEDFGVQVELLEELLPVYYVGETVSIPIRVSDMTGKPIPNISVSGRLGHRRNATTGYTNKDGVFTFTKKLTQTGNNFIVVVDDLLPYTGTTETYTTQVTEPTSIPITCELGVVSAEESGVSLSVEFFDGEDPFTCDASVTLLYNPDVLGQWTIEEDTSTIISTPEGMTWTEGSTYTFKVQSSVTSVAPRGYKYTTEQAVIQVLIPGDAELLPVSVDASVTSAGIDGITVQALFTNSDTSTSINLDGVVKLYDVTGGGVGTLWDTVNLSNQSSATLSSPSGTLAPATYNLKVELVAENPPEGYYYDNPVIDTVTATVNPVLIPVTLDTTVTSATTSGVSVDVDFKNTTTSASLSLNGTITMSIDDGTTTTLLDTETLTNASTVTLESPSGSTFQDGNYTLLFELNATNPPVGYYYDNPITAVEMIDIGDIVIVEPCTSLANWTSTNTDYMPKISTILNQTCVEAPTGSNPTSFLWAHFTGDISLAEHTTIELDAYIGANSAWGTVGLATTNFRLGDHQYRKCGVLQNQRNSASLANHDGPETSVAQPPINAWFALRFEINQRTVTMEYTSGAGNPVSASTTVGDYSTDETLNNIVRLGMQSAASGYPRVAVKNIVITKHRT